MQIQALHKSVNLLIFLVVLAGCSQTPTPPQISLHQPLDTHQTHKIFSTSGIAIPEPCKGIKIVGELTPFEFEKFFHCLNQKGGLEGLKPLVLGNPENTVLFTKLYNENFGANPTARKSTLDLIHRLDENQGLSDLLKVITLFITEFIDTPDFDQNLKPLLTDILSDDIDMLSLLKSVVTYRDFEKLRVLVKDTLQDDRLGENLNAFSAFLKYTDSTGQTGSQNLVTFLKNALSLSKSHFITQAFDMEDAYQLALLDFPLHLLRTLYHLKERKTQEGVKLPSLIPSLTQLLFDLSHRRTETILTEERIQALANPNSSLSPQQRDASLKVLKSHPANDLIALVKLTSSFHRGFVGDETGENRNILNSLDKFLQDVKASLDAHPKLGPESEVAQRMTTYRIYINFAHQEIAEPDFHKLSDEEKFNFYTAEDGQSMYSVLIKIYKIETLRRASNREEERLRTLEPPLSEDELQRQLREFRRTFQTETLPPLVSTYRTFLNQEIKNAIDFINHYPLLLGSTAYDLLSAIKNTNSISLLILQAVLNLKNESLHALIEQLVERLREFHNFNRPVEAFMKSVEEDSIADSTWLHHTIDPILYFMGKEVPLKDRISIMAFVQSYQAIERLLLTENRLWEIKDVLLPFIQRICGNDQEKLILDFTALLHSGNFYLDREENRRDDDHEAKELIAQVSPLLITMLESGFFEQTLNLMASFGDPVGQAAETFNQFIEFLLYSEGPSQKRAIDPLIKTLEHISQNHPQQLKQCLDHLAQFLTPQTIQHLKSFFLKYEEVSHSESILTQMIKRDEIKPFLHTMKHMLEQDTFRSTHQFMKQLIESGQLEESLRLLIKLLVVNGGTHD